MTRRIRHLAAAGFVAASAWIAAGALSAQQVRDRVATPPPAAAAAAAGGGAVVSGTLLSDELTPQPVRRAQMSLISSDATVARNALTDASGRFAFADLPAGRFTLAASKPGWVRASYGAKRYDRPGTTITLTDGQKMTGVAMKMAHGGVIAGTILDETGLPAQGVQVRVMQYRMLNGERTLAPVTAGGLFGETTDDRGAFRLFGLPAGDYVLSAQPRNMGGEIRAMTPAEIRAALAALQQPNAPSATVNATAGAPTPSAPTPRPDPETVGYASVYYPGTVTVSSAATVALGPGEERTGVDFSLQLVRTAKVEGTIVAPSGVPAQNVQLTMLPTSTGTSLPAIGPTLLNRAAPGPDGKFTYTAIPPGQYTIMARATRPAGGGAGAPATRVATENVIGFAVQGDGRGGGGGGAPGNLDMMIGQLGDQSAQFWAMADVTVDGSPVSGIVLTLQPGMTLAGRIEFNATRGTPPADLSRVRVTLAPAPTGGGPNIVLGAPLAQVDGSGKFTVSGVTPGRYRLNGVAPVPQGAGPGQTWTLKSAVVKGKDVLDFPLDIGPGEEIADAVLTFTDATQQVGGTLQDATGRPAPDYTIVVFAADKAYWTGTSRRIRTARPGTDGKFTVTGLPAGDYRIAALTDVAPNEVNDPALLEQLVGASIQFTLGEGERKVQDLMIKGS